MFQVCARMVCLKEEMKSDLYQNIGFCVGILPQKKLVRAKRKNFSDTNRILELVLLRLDLALKFLDQVVQTAKVLLVLIDLNTSDNNCSTVERTTCSKFSI